MPRNPCQGLTTLATLAAVLLLATLTLTLQTRTQADLRVLARLTDDLETRAAKDSLYDRLRPLIAGAMAGIPDAALTLDSTPLILTEQGRDWEVRVQDVEGQIDLYLAPPDLLALLPIPPETATLRTTELAQLPPGARFPVLPSTAARFGRDVAHLADVCGPFTWQKPMRPRFLPDGSAGADVLPAGGEDGSGRLK
ncbi:MAG: hypothetical protein B7Z31_02320 [Rhodobacterales bacterium 12-65-15]|nr:MAG: hypothetical protein B7Z31_02320 [Rhodobacterales bacterium 12-65-15]